MHRAFGLLAALTLCGSAAASGQAMREVPLGGEIRIWTLDERYTKRQMYLINVRADTLVLKDVRTGAPARVLRTSLRQLEVFRPGGGRREQANLYAGYGFIGAALVGAALPSNTIAGHRGSAAFQAGFGGALVGWWVGFARAGGRWERVNPSSGRVNSATPRSPDRLAASATR
jgi:hypothetical protein